MDHVWIELEYREDSIIEKKDDLIKNYKFTEIFQKVFFLEHKYMPKIL